MNATEPMRTTRDDHDARCIGIGASGEEAREDGVDEDEVRKVGDGELGLVPVGADAVFVLDGSKGVGDDGLRGGKKVNL